MKMHEVEVWASKPFSSPRVLTGARQREEREGERERWGGGSLKWVQSEDSACQDERSDWACLKLGVFALSPCNEAYLSTQPREQEAGKERAGRAAKAGGPACGWSRGWRPAWGPTHGWRPGWATVISCWLITSTGGGELKEDSWACPHPPPLPPPWRMEHSWETEQRSPRRGRQGMGVEGVGGVQRPSGAGGNVIAIIITDIISDRAPNRATPQPPPPPCWGPSP